VRAFGGLDAMNYEDVPRPSPGSGQVLVRVAAAGVGPWDAWIRAGKSVVPQPLPLVLGSDLSGVVEEVGPGVTGLRRGDAVFGVTNPRFTGAYAEYAAADVGMIARTPTTLGDLEAASMPVVASTAWQMLFDYAAVEAGCRVLVHGGAGNVGAYAVQLAHLVGARVVATPFAEQIEYVRSLGAEEVLEPRPEALRRCEGQMDAVIDTLGGRTLEHSFELLRRGGTLVSAVAEPDRDAAARHGVRALFILISVTTAGLARLGELVATDRLRTSVGEVLPLSEARVAHAMLDGQPHKRGKIVLVPDPPSA
ncbi:MAG: NADP-dependent oxidoreductase, partial [Acetobacteraceae bacterium]|nr:NADP-dependent oxidoreductase [Acetobacteraceae bacterium]